VARDMVYIRLTVGLGLEQVRFGLRLGLLGWVRIVLVGVRFMIMV